MFKFKEQNKKKTEKAYFSHEDSLTVCLDQGILIHDSEPSHKM